MKHFDFNKFALYDDYLYINCIAKGNFDDKGNIVSKLILPKSKQKVFRKTLEKFYNNHDKIPVEVLEKISENNSDEDIINFLHDNYIETLDSMERAKTQNSAVCSEFPDDISVLLMSMDNLWICNESPLEVNENGELKIVFKTSYGFVDSLVLKNAVISHEVEAYNINGFEYSKVDGIYILELAVENDIITVKFQSVEHIQEFYDYSTIGTGIFMTNENCQWIIVANMLDELKNLEMSFGSERLSNKEKLLLPLTHFAPIMTYSGYYDLSYHNKSGIAFFESYLEAHKIEFLLPLINKLKQCKPLETDNAINNTYYELKRISKKISNALRDKRCEPLWRQLYNELKEAASVYPQKTSVNKTEADRVRNSITEALLSQGFEGEYPLFRKMSSLKGIKLLENQINTYFVINEKCMLSYIYCEEHSRYNENLSVNFLCGTIFLKEEQADAFNDLDAYSAFFLDKDRRFATVIHPKSPDIRDDELVLNSEADVALVAAKKACLQKISKEEKSKTLVMDNTSVFALLVFFTIFGSLFFGLAMTIGFMLITLVLVGVLTFSLKTAFEAFQSVPWHWIFLGTGLSFGIIMGIITAITKMKK